mgnify:CR=1 FL=1
MHRFLISTDLPSQGIFILDKREVAHQMRRVLKMKKGEHILLFNGTGKDFEMEIERLTDRFITGRILRVSPNHTDPDREVHLYQSLLTKDKLGWVLGKGTELGVKFFNPMLSKYSMKKSLNRDRALRILTEATEQSGQDRLPKLAELIDFETAIKEVPSSSTFLIDPSGESWKEAPLKTIHLFVGPEGGFTAQEVKLAGEKGFKIVSFGPRTLRAETAAIVAASMCLK